MPEARQNNSKLAAIFERASSFSALVGMAVDVVLVHGVALLCGIGTPEVLGSRRATPPSPISTSSGTIPCCCHPSKRGVYSAFVKWGPGVFCQTRGSGGPIAHPRFRVVIRAFHSATLSRHQTRQQSSGGGWMPRVFSSAAIAQTLVIPWDRRSSTMARGFARDPQR